MPPNLGSYPVKRAKNFDPRRQARRSLAGSGVGSASPHTRRYTRYLGSRAVGSNRRSGVSEKPSAIAIDVGAVAAASPALTQKHSVTLFRYCVDLLPCLIDEVIPCFTVLLYTFAFIRGIKRHAHPFRERPKFGGSNEVHFSFGRA
jgi:hypothetical protein